MGQRTSTFARELPFLMREVIQHLPGASISNGCVYVCSIFSMGFGGLCWRVPYLSWSLFGMGSLYLPRCYFAEWGFLICQWASLLATGLPFLLWGFHIYWQAFMFLAFLYLLRGFHTCNVFNRSFTSATRSQVFCQLKIKKLKIKFTHLSINLVQVQSFLFLLHIIAWAQYCGCSTYLYRPLISSVSQQRLHVDG